MEHATHHRLACIECDLLVTLGALRDGDRALCPRCGHLLKSQPADGLTRSLAFALTAAVLLVMANSFPFLALKASGLENVMTLPRAAMEIYRDGYGAMAALVMGVIVVIPGVIIGTLVTLLIAVRNDHGAPWLVSAGRLVFWLAPWSMSEVFVIGVIVSLVKIDHMATVVIGVSFWSYVAFAMCFTAALSGLDRIEIWDEIERCTA